MRGGRCRHRRSAGCARSRCSRWSGLCAAAILRGASRGRAPRSPPPCMPPRRDLPHIYGCTLPCGGGGRRLCDTFGLGVAEGAIGSGTRKRKADVRRVSVSEPLHLGVCGRSWWSSLPFVVLFRFLPLLRFDRGFRGEFKGIGCEEGEIGLARKGARGRYEAHGAWTEAMVGGSDDVLHGGILEGGWAAGMPGGGRRGGVREQVFCIGSIACGEGERKRAMGYTRSRVMRGCCGGQGAHLVGRVG